MQLNVSNKVNSLLEQSLQLSISQGRFYVGVEHLFCVILDKADTLPPSFWELYGNDLMKVLREVGRTSWKGDPRTETNEVFYTPRCINTIQQAAKVAARHGQVETDSSHLLLAILADCRSAPSRVMDSMRMDRGDCIKALLRDLGMVGQQKTAQPVAAARPATGQPAPAVSSQAQNPAVEAAPDAAKAKLDSLTRDLTKIAREGKLQPAIGRDAEIFEILQVLSRKSKNNVMIVGEAGVGKTQIVEGIALNIAKGETMNAMMPPFRILELNIAAMMAGTQFRGAFEEKLLSLLEQLKNEQDTILFIDEAHLIMGAGATEGDGMDMANLLKPALARGEIRCIGATTLREYRKFVEKDPAIERRFQMVRVEELSEEATYEVMGRVVPSLETHHGVRITEQAVETAIKLTQRHLPNRCLPDKAIDVLDQACARYRLKLMAQQNNPKSLENTMVASVDVGVTPHEIRKVISRMTAVPIEEMTAEERMHLGAIEKKIKEKLIGQDEAVSKSVASVKKSRAGLADPNRPDAVLLFLGPSGVGKTQLAKLLASYLFGSPNHLITFDMSEYIEEHSVSRLLGAPPGYVGAEEEGRLTGAVRTTPFSILLFDEIEKAHQRIFDIFLPIFDEGRLKDSRGRDASFKNCIIIMTSNIGADILSNPDVENPRAALVEELRRHFRPEFINRIDDIIPFYPLLNEDVRSILRLEINAVRGRLQEKQLRLRMYQRAYEYLLTKGYSPQFGARELRRIVDQEITMPISDLILRNKFSAGDVINVMVEKDHLAFVKGDTETDEERRKRKMSK
jgi:ATP-dependent Clp protease ATP-binding subunit ClpC